MANLFYCSWDDGHGWSDFDSFGSGFGTGYETATGISGMTGTVGRIYNKYGYYAQKEISPVGALYFSSLVRYVSTETQGEMCSFGGSNSSNGWDVSLLVIDDGSIRAYRYPGLQLAATGTGIWTSGQTKLVESYVTIADTGGRCIVRIDGGTVIDYTGDTKGAGETQISHFRIGCGPGRYVSYWWDDVLADDSDWPSVPASNVGGRYYYDMLMAGGMR